MGGFNEGLAMVAAAGGPDVHPHADSSEEERALWDTETAKFGQYLRQQDQYFGAVLTGTAGTEKEINEAMFAYFGEQGPWYTVGWRMAVTIERTFGREAVVDAFCRPGALLKTYNEAAFEQWKRTGEALPLWHNKLVSALAR